MPDFPASGNDFLNQLTSAIEKNLSDEQFGVSELAAEMNMSRSNLLRKVKKLTKLSVSQLIRQVRLQRGMDMLRKSPLNVSEVSHQVGFSSTSYFIKCFREHYGYPPGEAGKRSESEINPAPGSGTGLRWHNSKRHLLFVASAGLVVVLAALLFIYYYVWPYSAPASPEKSIAVLPFKNDSNDSTNVYLINGLMEATLNNLQKIGDLKVISRTSSEKYRNTSKSIPEMAKELNVNYFVEGSGQKIGNQILLNVQLIEAVTDRHLWSRQYRREAKDIFELQHEVAKNIAEEIQAIITPEEERRIEKKPTGNLVAYDLFLKGRELFHEGSHKNLEGSLPYFKKAIEHDHQFALAYANVAMVYYYLDIFQTNKKYEAEINSYADKALLLDSKLGESLVAKALFYIHKKEHESAVPYLEKALEYNPNSSMVVHFLTEFYNAQIPNTAKYLEYALKGVRLDVASHDSTTTSYKYLHLSNALIQTGFIDEALVYIEKSLAYDPANPFSGLLKVYILFAKSGDLKQTRELLVRELAKDTTRFFVVQEVGKICYYMRDYKSAYRYYKRFIEFRESQQLDIYKYEDLKIGMVLVEMGLKKESEAFIQSFKQFADDDRSIYKHLNLSGYYCWKGDVDKAMEHLELFSKEDNYQYWILLYQIEPSFDHMKDNPRLKKIMGDIEARFWATHKKIRVTLEDKGLL